MNNQYLRYANYAMIAFLGIAIITAYADQSASGSAPSPTAAKGEAIPQVVKPVDLDRPFDFAGEALPMDNFDVRERLDRELLVNTYWQSNTLLNIKNAYKFFPMMERIMKEYGIPDDFKYLAVAESSLRNAVSPAGARGLWQIMPSTAKEFGLEINSEVDERYHYEKSTVAACKMLRNYYRSFGSWTLVAAAYNTGFGRIKKELEAQRAEDYYALNLTEETSRYVFRLVAIKEILSRPEDFGFYVGPEHGYPPIDEYRSLTVKESIPNLGDFANAHNTTYRMIKVYNPWLLGASLTVSSGNSYEIKVPK